ncbi:hypothetical protein LHYA1_G006729 [Lachnellula hyalina]|uniref:Uncharacterized protein n=1 Tax=Lachnellula hyalina TaxID=1316788 RepID=A0A8H8TYA4_9HELO|nr:uncharacterized protein LHYA1_G006729 [Lachnellula hyalina]TVY24712.1 hypothetical protein LHYA1_G006729 [Lachnellula hyalina]
MLCSNRPEGFGPHSTLSSPIPTTCFVDTIIIPLPVWIALFLLPLLITISLHHRKQNFDPSTAHLRAVAPRSCSFITVHILFYLFIIANILMLTLEIVRLELLHFGIGLLPFSYVGLLLGAGLHASEGFRGHIRGWQVVNGVLWLGGMVVSIVQVVGLNKEGIHGRKGTKYPISDQVIDVAVMAGVYAAIALLEVGLGAWSVKRDGGRRESLKSGIGGVGQHEMTDYGAAHHRS